MDFLLPNLGSTYSSMLDGLKARDEDILKWLDGTSSTNLPVGAKRWNSTNTYWEKFDGVSWSPLASKYLINVDQVDGCTVNDSGTTTTDLWTASKITSQLNTKVNTSTYTASDILTKLKTVDGAASGLDTEFVNGRASASTNTGNTVVIRDNNGDFSAGTITATLVGNSSTSTKLTTARTLALTGNVTGSATFDGSANATITATVSSINGIVPNTDNVVNTIVQRDVNGDISARSLKSSFSTTNGNVNFIMTQVNQTTDSQLKPCTPQQLASVVQPHIQSLTSGTIIINTNGVVPSGYLECNGTELSRTTYASLFAAIGTIYGAGDGTTTFKIPDLRGEFIRGWDNGRGIDPSRGIGTFQADELKSHNHTYVRTNYTTSATDWQFAGSYSLSQDTTDTSSTGGSETRPRNVAMMYCIKY